MQSTREFFVQTLGIEAWLAMVLAILILALVATQVTRVLFNQLERLAARSYAVWDEALVAAARVPIHLVIAVVVLSWIARVLHAQWPEPDFTDEITQTRNVFIVLTLVWFVWKFIALLTNHTIQRGRDSGQDFDLTTIYAISKLGRLLVVVVGAIMAANTLGFNVGTLLALGGVGGIAVGLAAKDLLANFFGGLTIYLDRPFSVGDWIRSPDKSIEGTEIDPTQTLIVNFNAFAASSLNIMIYTFTHTINWVKYHAVKQDVLIAIGRVVERHGAKIAFPTQTLHLSQPLVGPPGEALAKA